MNWRKWVLPFLILLPGFLAVAVTVAWLSGVRFHVGSNMPLLIIVVIVYYVLVLRPNNTKGG